MEGKNLVYVDDELNLCLVAKKICAFAPVWDKNQINIWIDSSEDAFICRYSTREELNCGVQRLEAAINILNMKSED